MPQRLLQLLAKLVAIACLAHCGKKTTPPSHASSTSAAAAPIVAPDDKVHPTYAGSISCKECHEKAYADWKNSHHGLAERPVQPDQLDQQLAAPLKLEHNGRTSQAYLDKEQLLRIVTQGKEPKPLAYPVARIIGHNPLRQFLIPAPGNRLQTCDVTYDPKRNELFDVFGTDERKPGDWGHWTGQGMNWNAMCAACHNTRLRKNFDPATNSYNTRMAEMAVSCESCHGPMKAHVTWQQQTPQSSPSLKDPHLPKFSRDQMLETCAPCHARRSELTGDMIPGSSFYDHNSLTVTDLTDIFHADGQIRDENYEATSFLSSKMHHAGVRCVDCHDSHTGKTKLPGNALCMQCHTTGTHQNLTGEKNHSPAPLTRPAPIIVPTLHSHHGEGSTGNDCINCHMPTTTYMQRHPRHDHSYSIPNPRLTIEHGIPNACNKCHTDQSPTWALTHAKQWYGSKLEKPTHLRADLITRARRQDPTVQPQLIEMLRTEVIPTWQATACHLMAPWLANPAIRQSLTAALANPSPLVREAAVRTLAPMVRENHQPTIDSLRPLLADSSRAVRIAAAWALCATLDLTSPAGKELVHMLDLHADQPTGRMQLSQFAFLRGNPTAAISQAKQAIRMDPNSAPMHHDLAILLSTIGDNAAALLSLQEASRLEANNSEYHFKLALVHSELGKPALAIAALEKTTALDPGYARAWYNLGLAYNGQGDTANAIAALSRGETADPNDAEIPYARATIHYRLGQKQEARAAALRTLQIRPDHPQARQLLE